MNWPGEVSIETGVARLGNRSFDLVQTLICNGTVCGRGRTVLVVMDRTARKAVPIDPWRARLAVWKAADA